MTRLIQLQQGKIRKLALVDEPHLRLLAEYATIYDLAQAASQSATSLSQLTQRLVTDQTTIYDDVYTGQSDWRILPAADHPYESARCLVTGTGLTHTASAKNRNAMHAQTTELTDSMKMFQWGIAGGRPGPGQIGTAPEWFYKGSGEVLRAHNEPLVTPAWAEDGGEEPEIAGVYLIGPDGHPCRIGFTMGNEFSDHKFEKRNYLYLAGSKLRTCAIGPELVVEHDFQTVPGTVMIERDGAVLWSAEINSGETSMCHSLANIEHHHFKFHSHRRPGDLHVHFFGADAFSFGAGIELQQGDVMKVSFAGFGRPLCNPVQIETNTQQPVIVTSLA